MRTVFASILLAGAGLIHAQGPTPTDLAEKARQALAISEAKADADIQDAIFTAKKLAKTFPDKALRDLKALGLKLDTLPGVSNSKRESLQASLKDAGIAIAGGDMPNTRKTELRPDVIARIEKSKKTVEAANAETLDVRAKIDEIAKDLNVGKDREAKIKTEALAKLYPNNPAVLELGLQTNFRDSVLYAQDLSKRTAEGFRVAMNSVQESAIPTSGDISFPKDWKEKMERRRKLNAPTLSAAEQKLVESLAIPVKNELRNAPFEEAIQTLASTIDQKIYLDKKSLDDTGIDLRSTVNVPGGVTARQALRVMLQQQGLTFIIRDNIIQVVTLDQASKVLVTRAYDVRDIVGNGGPFNGLMQWGPYLDAQQTMANAAILIETVQKGIDPASWKETGKGNGTITFHYPTMSLIVRAPSEVHAELYDKMYPARR